MSPSANLQPEARADDQPEASAEVRVARLLAGLWQRNQAQVEERLALLERAAADMQAGTLSPTLREQAISTAHKLAGTLGMFGFPRGTEIARILEREFDADAPDAERSIAEAASLRRMLFPPAA